jgi:phosphohistidine swiveling domain-containing protein
MYESMEQIIAFGGGEQASVDLESVGGKALNLIRLTQGGFAVPPGFCITTSAYRTFLAAHGLDPKIDELVEALDPMDASAVEAATESIRTLIEKATLPKDLEVAIEHARSSMGLDAQSRVAVRSSGTAEDLEEASFAGLHDTYLHVVGLEETLLAVKRCWASLWTARATSYRARRGFDSVDASICVVVQLMVDAEVSGVMFTGNPTNAATDEILINASWGLGEAVVQGATTPDSFIVKTSDLRVRERVSGSKEKQVVRDPDAGSGTADQPVPEHLRSQLTLSDEQVVALAGIGRQVQEYYNGLPQDIEWALADGQFFVLQARPVTGVEFSWDTDVDSFQDLPEEPDDQLWSRTWADEGWTGAITPLFYSIREPVWSGGTEYWATTTGKFDELARTRLFKYHKAEAYWNLRYEKAFTTETFPPPFRRLGVWDHLPASMLDETFEGRFDWLGYAKMYGRAAFSTRDGFWSWNAYLKETYYENEDAVRYAEGPSDAELARLTDGGLQQVLQEYTEYEVSYGAVLWSIAFFYLRDVLCALNMMLNSWYDGDVNAAYVELMSGSTERTPTVVENHELWRLARTVAASSDLSDALTRLEPAAFFAYLESSEDGRRFLADYGEFARTRPHRGHADRDIYYPRRGDDPAMDLHTLRAYMALEQDPTLREHEVNGRREARVADIVKRIKSTSLGGLKAQAFLVLYRWMMQFIVWRDVERDFADRSTYTIRRICLEINRRLMRRGVLHSDRDFWFLNVDELFEVLNGRANMTLAQAKIEARKRNFDRFLNKEVTPPMYIQNGLPIDLDQPADNEDDGTLRGVGYSSGIVSGIARVIKTQQELGRVAPGEILVCNSTDPGWTAAFNVISGIVTETGGALAHAACLAREYGLPGVQVAGAMKHIPDGARITLDGSAGRLNIELPVESPVKQAS